MAVSKIPKTVKALYDYTNKRFDEIEERINHSEPTPIPVFKNTKKAEYTASCISGFTGTPVTKIKETGTVTSIISEADANEKAISEAKIEAKAALVCIAVPVSDPDPIPVPPITTTPPITTEQFRNVAQSYTAKAPTGYSGEETVSLPALHMSSHISQADADNTALEYCKNLATGTLLRTMKVTTPYAKDGFNSTQGNGSIDKNSDVIILDASMGFKVGDYLIVETGGETGKGQRGTIGVGGQWPYTVYNTVAEMEADTSREDGFYAGTLDDCKTHRSIGGDWIDYVHWGFYTEQIIPHNLDAKVIAVSTDGKKITLNKKAKVSSIGANIYYDHAYLFAELFKNETTNIPAGKFAISWHIDASKEMRLIAGAGKDKTIIFSPNGSPSASIRINAPHSVYGKPTIRDLTVIGGNRKTGYRFMESETLEPFPISGYLGNDYLFLQTPAIWMSSKFAIAENIRVIDPMGYAFESNTGTLKINGCDVVLTEGERLYQGWYYHVAGQNDNDPWTEITNCTFTSPTFAHAWEAFRSMKVLFKNNRSINGMMGINGAVDCTIENMDFYGTATASPAWAGQALWVDCNSFLGATQAIIFRNINIHQTMLPNGTTLNGIFGRANTTGIKIYNSTFSKPNGTNADPSQAINIEAVNAVVDNVKVIGNQGPFFQTNPTFFSASISVREGQLIGASVVKNTSADVIKLAPGVKSENNKCNTCK